MNIKEQIPTIYLEDYDITVNQYLTYSQIQTIVNDTEALMQHVEKDESTGKEKISNSWAERQTNIDMLVLMYATDINADDLGKYGHVAMLQNGIVDVVKKNILNYWQLEEAFRYTESWDKVLMSAVKQIGGVIQKYGEKAIIKELVNRDELQD